MNLWQWRSTVEEAMMMAMMITIWKDMFETPLLGLLAICVCKGTGMIVMMMTTFMMMTIFLMMATSLAARPHAWYVVLSSTMSGSGGRLGTL